MGNCFGELTETTYNMLISTDTVAGLDIDMLTLIVIWENESFECNHHLWGGIGATVITCLWVVFSLFL